MGRKSNDLDKREYCGAFGIYSFSGKEVAYDIYLGLMNLQHRGQDAAGAAVSDGKGLSIISKVGMVSEVLNNEGIAQLKGFAGIGHVRYPTIGGVGEEDAQPFLAEAKGKKFALAHNGNISNYGKLRKEMEENGTKFTSTCDAELILEIFIREYEKSQDIFKACFAIMDRADGSYSTVMASSDGELIAFRDPNAIRPLCFGKNGDKIVFASESVALDILNCKLEGDLEPGEIAMVSYGKIEKRTYTGKRGRRHCMFEYVYFSRPDSKIDGRWVYEVRHALGKALARDSPVKADIIVPVPDTARSAAEGYSEESGIPVAEGLIKNRYVWRTFIMASQEKRDQSVRLKLNAVKHVVDGKKIILIDDSIVRGTTMAPIVKLLREAGAKEIHLRITCPPITGPCFYGIDMPTYTELVASKKSVEEIRQLCKADSLAYQSIEGLVKAIRMDRKDLCLGCLTGEYPTEFGIGLAEKIKKQGSKEGVRAWEEKG